MEADIHVSNRLEHGKRPAAPVALILGLLCISLLFGVLAASSESLWIDEGFSAYFANQPDFTSYLEAMRRETGSDAQAPFYTAYLWGWRHGFGVSEQSLRLANLPWILLGQGVLLVAMWRAGMRRRCLVLFTLAAAVSPFLSFYINQARCYGMQYGAACLALAYLVAVSASPGEAFRPGRLGVGLGGLALLCGTSLLGVAWVGTAILAAAWLLWMGRSEVEKPGVAAWGELAGAAAVLGLLGVYYFGTLLRGARAAGGATNLGSVLFCAYEMLGLAGFGPGRNALRELGPQAALADAPALIVAGAVVLGTLLWGGWLWWRGWRKSGGAPASARALGFALLPLVFMFGVGAVVHFRVLGRHLIAVYPLILLLFALACEALWEARRRWLPVALLAVWAASAGLLRFAERHRRDDYRSAAGAALAAMAAGERVWWAADRYTGEYYGLKFARGSRVREVFNASPEELAALPRPGRIILSKPGIYDGPGSLRGYIAREGYVARRRFPAFTVFEACP